MKKAGGVEEPLKSRQQAVLEMLRTSEKQIMVDDGGGLDSLTTFGEGC